MGKLAYKIQYMGELASTKERTVDKFKGFLVYAIRGFRAFHVLVGVDVLGTNLEEATEKQPIITRAAFSERDSCTIDG